jgi:hypothetical protein
MIVSWIATLTADTHVQQLTIVDCYINSRHARTTDYYHGLLNKHQTHMYKAYYHGCTCVSAVNVAIHEVSCCTCVSGVYLAIHDSNLLYMCVWCLFSTTAYYPGLLH